MLANFLEKTKPITFVLLLALFFCFFILALSSNFSINFYWENPLLSYVTYFFSLVFYFLFFNFIIIKNTLTLDNSFAFFFFIICLGIMPFSFLDEKTLIVNLIILLFLRKVYSLKSLKKVIQKLFDGGFWLGISFIIEPSVLVFAVLLYASIYINIKITIQTLLVPLIAFLIPLFLYFTYCFWQNEISSFYNLFYWKMPSAFDLYFNLTLKISVILLSVFLVISIFLKTPKALSISNSFRKSWILILIHLTTAIILVTLIKEKTGSELIYTFFPLAIILANGLELIKKSIYKNVVIILFLALAIITYL